MARTATTRTTGTLLPLLPAAAALAVTPRTVQRWTRTGCPVARRGRRGHGGAALYDIAAVRAWREATADDRLRVLAAELPQLTAAAVWKVFQDTPNRRAAAEPLVRAWYATTLAALDRIGQDVPGIPQVEVYPPEIAHVLAHVRSSSVATYAVAVTTTSRGGKHSLP